MCCYAQFSRRLVAPALSKRARVMSAEFRIAVLVILVILAWVVAKVCYYKSKSARQWQNVDKSKLKEWEDDDW